MNNMFRLPYLKKNLSLALFLWDHKLERSQVKIPFTGDFNPTVNTVVSFDKCAACCDGTVQSEHL